MARGETGGLEVFGSETSSGTEGRLTQEFLQSADYSHNGHDLVLTGQDGARLVIEDYFATPHAPPLVADNGAYLSGETVTLLAGARDIKLAQASGEAPSSYGEPIGRISTLDGTATVKHVDGQVVALNVGSPVYEDDVVSTAPSSKLGITFVDKSVFSLSADATMVLNEMVYDPGSSSGNSMVFNLLKGSLGFATGGVAPTGGVTIETPVASMAIRGTHPIFLDLGNGKYVFMSDEGQFQVTPKLPGGQVITVSASSGDAWLFNGTRIQLRSPWRGASSRTRPRI